MRFNIKNMTCGGCARSVTKAVQSVDPDATVEIDLPTKNIEITSQKSAGEFENILAKIGYPAVSVT